MRKAELARKTDAVVSATREALQAVYDALNQGQRKKLLKNEQVAALLARYQVEV